MTRNNPSPTRGWTVVLAALSINLILGVLYAWGVVAKALTTQWQWSKTEAALPFTVSTACFALMMIFAGRLQDRIGPRFVAMSGGIILGVALIASSFVSTSIAMVLTFGIIGGLGIGLGYSATTPPAIKWFHPSRKGLITGIVVSGVGLAAVYISPLTEYLLKTTSIPRTFLVLGIGAIVLVALLSQFLSNPPAGYIPTPVHSTKSGPATTPRPGRDLDWNEMVRTRQFYLLWLMFVMGASAGLMIIAHVAIIAKEQAGLAWGFIPIATLAIFNTVGRITSGFLSDKIGRSRTMVLAFVLQAINMFIFTYYTSPSLVIFGSAFTGLCYGTLFTLMPSATADFYGVRNLGVNYGLLFTAFGVAGVFGPMLGGRVRDTFGSYHHSFLISAGLLLVGAVLAFTLRPPITQTASVEVRPETRQRRELAVK
jgi:OFA family oxalate/formate antiporter-like MFS transporter